MTDESLEVPAAPPAPSRVAKWKNKKRINGITLPSQEVVSLVLPDLAEMLREGAVPNELVPFATKTQNAMAGVEEIDMEQIIEATEFMRWMVSVTVVDPQISASDVPEIPSEDREMILEFAMRQRDTDAIGHHYHGLEKVAAWRTFRYGQYGN